MLISLLTLVSKQETLHSKGKIFGCYVSKRSLKIKLQENSALSVKAGMGNRGTK